MKFFQLKSLRSLCVLNKSLHKLNKLHLFRIPAVCLSICYIVVTSGALYLALLVYRPCTQDSFLQHHSHMVLLSGSQPAVPIPIAAAKGYTKEIFKKLKL